MADRIVIKHFTFPMSECLWLNMIKHLKHWQRYCDVTAGVCAMHSNNITCGLLSSVPRNTYPNWILSLKLKNIRLCRMCILHVQELSTYTQSCKASYGIRLLTVSAWRLITWHSLQVTVYCKMFYKIVYNYKLALHFCVAYWCVTRVSFSPPPPFFFFFFSFNYIPPLKNYI